MKIIWINGRFLAGYIRILLIFQYIIKLKNYLIFIGKLWETVQKQITNHFQECLYYQPALIIIDDMDDLCHLNSEPNEHADMSKIYLRYF